MSEQKVVCFCGYNKTDGPMLKCDVCGNHEHQACRGYLREFEGPHSCYGCAEVRITPKGQSLCLVRRSLERIIIEQKWKCMSLKKLTDTLGVSGGKKIFDKLVASGYIEEPQRNGWGRINRELIINDISTYFKDTENWTPDVASNKENLPAKKDTLEAETKTLKAENESLKKENLFLKRKIEELEELEDASSLSSDSDSKKVKLTKEPQDFLEDLQSILGDTQGKQALIKIHETKQIGAPGYCKNYEEVYGKSKFSCWCGKRKLSASGFYRHIRYRSTPNCIPVPVEYCTVLNMEITS